MRPIATTGKRAPRTRLALMVVAVALIAVSGITVWVTTGRSYMLGEGDFSPTSRSDQQRAWQDAEFQPMQSNDGEPIGVPILGRRIGDSIEDPGGVLGRDLRGSLVRALSEQAIARSNKSADAYLALAADGCSRWMTEHDAREWAMIAEFSEGVLKHPADSRDPKAVLSRIASYCLGGVGGQFKEVGVGRRGARTRVFRVRSEVELLAKIAPGSEADAGYWYGPTHSAFMLRRPVRSLNEVIATERSVVCADCLMLVRTANGHVYTWHSTWFYDPALSCWGCYQMSRAGGLYSYLMFY